MEQPNFFGLSIAYDPYMREVVQADKLTTCGGDGGRSICGGLGPFLGFLPCSPHCKPEVQEDNEMCIRDRDIIMVEEEWSFIRHYTYTVSYTHLDVYKRQLWYHADARRRWSVV